MANIRIDLSTPIEDGQTLTFKAPVDCSEVTGLSVYYTLNGGTELAEFQFTDAHGNDIGNIDLFSAESIVKVILDIEHYRAFVQNADTNAYLERQLASKAPAGYGLGKAKRISVSTNIDDVTAPGWYDFDRQMNLGGITANYWYMQVSAYSDGENHCVQKVYPCTGNYSTVELVRFKFLGNWSDFVRSDAGAFAKSSYGAYGEYLAYSFQAADESEMETSLTTIISAMDVNSSKRIQFTINKIGDEVVGSWNWLATIHKTSSGYAFITASSGYGNRVVQFNKYLSAGSWKPIEWVNPPLTLGREYRTSERFNGEPVFVKAINFGTGPSSSVKNAYIADYVGDVIRIDGYWYRTGTKLFRLLFTDADFINKIQVKSDTNGATGVTTWVLSVDVSADSSAYTGLPVIYYTKRTL